MNGYDVKDVEQVEIGRFKIVKSLIGTENGFAAYTYVKIKPGVAILPIVEDRIALIKQYRLALDAWEWEIPAGMINDREAPRDTAFRELKEETGYGADQLTDLGEFFPSGGSTDERIYLYAAECSIRTQQQLDDTERIEVELFSKEEVLNMIRENQLRQGAALAAILKFYGV